MLFGLYFIVAVSAALQAWFGPPKTFFAGGKQYTQYNNYLLFKNSSIHLQQGKDLYQLFPEETWDLYKYSPTFALLFSPFKFLPDWAGLLLWDLLNALVFIFAVNLLPKLCAKQKNLILLLALIEVVTSLQNEQSNALMAGLILLIFIFLEKRNLLIATLLLSFTLYLKLYGALAVVLFVFYPDKWKAAGYTLLWVILFFLLPLPVTGWHHLIALYHNWGHMLTTDISASAGLSVTGWLASWFNWHPDKFIIIVAGAILSALPLVRTRKYNQYKFRILSLAMLMIWMVIFNPKAESPTFVIAMGGAALWFAVSPKSRLNILLIVLALLFTSLSPTDLFPVSIRKTFFVPYTIKVVPCILIWIKILVDMSLLQEGKVKVERLRGSEVQR